MALIKCEDCENKYSNKAKECPKCGCPTINNTLPEKRKNIKKCSVKIKGNETFPPKVVVLDILTIFTISILIWFATTQIFQYDVFENGTLADNITGIVQIISFIIALASIPISMLFPEYKKRDKEAKTINEYFKKRFILLDSLSENHTETKIINKTNLTNDRLMFDIYMEAYKFNADAIVINDSNVTTHISGRTSSNIIGKGSSGTTTSTNKFHITATLVRY